MTFFIFLVRHAHQVTLLALHHLNQEVFVTFVRDGKSFVEWEDSMRKRSPTFSFWDMVMKHKTLVLMLVQAHRERDFALFVNVLEQLTPLFFALDQTNYARWVPIHIKDMKSLPEFMKREFQEYHHWVLSKTGKIFSSMPLDQANEPAN